MASTTYYIRIKKNYANDVIKDLQKMEAVEFLEQPPIPEWQKKEVGKRLKALNKNSVKPIGWKEATTKIKQFVK
ncbi:MAG: addiction module protein [Bacteroidetes bacterium]|nr:addiction module protein [Bacteroidota bacterium]